MKCWNKREMKGNYCLIWLYLPCISSDIFHFSSDYDGKDEDNVFTLGSHVLLLWEKGARIWYMTLQMLDGPFLYNLKSSLTTYLLTGSQHLQIEQFVVKPHQKPCPNLTLKTLLIYSGWNSRTFKPTGFPLTVLDDSPPKILCLDALIFGMRCIHCLILVYLGLWPAKWLQSTLESELVKGPRVTWRWSKMGRCPTWVVILLKSEQYCAHQPIWRRLIFAVSTSAATI